MSFWPLLRLRMEQFKKLYYVYTAIYRYIYIYTWIFQGSSWTTENKEIQSVKLIGISDYHDNNFSEMRDVEFTNNVAIICQNPRMTAINSCIEVDLTGQVCADSIGERLYSGFGGQIDFIRGAAVGLDGEGKAIIAMPSATRRGESKIVPILKSGMFNKLFNFSLIKVLKISNDFKKCGNFMCCCTSTKYST